jgi:hypothetical protein
VGIILGWLSAFAWRTAFKVNHKQPPASIHFNARNEEMPGETGRQDQIRIIRGHNSKRGDKKRGQKEGTQKEEKEGTGYL